MCSFVCVLGGDTIATFGDGGTTAEVVIELVYVDVMVVVAALWPKWCWWRHCGRISFGDGTVAEVMVVAVFWSK